MRLSGVILAIALFCCPMVAAQTTAPGQSKAVVIVLKGEIDEFNHSSLVKRFKEARSLGAQTIILQINTYGGLVTAGLEISQFLKQQNDLHVIALVDQKAISAGAMIALACNEIVMQPGAKLGDCAPISISSGGDLQTLGDTERAKLESPILEDFYDSAKRNGYDILLAQSMVSAKRTVHWLQSPSGERRFVDPKEYATLTGQGWTAVQGVPDPVDGPDTLLTVGSELAQKLGLAKGIEASSQSLAASRNLQLLATLEPSGGEAIVAFLGSDIVRGLLTTVFLMALYMCFSHPTHGAEVVAAIALIILLGVPLLTGYAQWWEVLAIITGLILIALEIFVIPGFGVTGITGIILVIAGLVMTFVPREPPQLPGFLPSLPGTLTALKHGLLIVLGGMASSMALWIWLQRYLPSLPYFNRLILTTTSGNLTVEPSISTDALWPAVGMRGRVVTDLRPGGTAAFFDVAINDDRTTDVISDSGFVPAGANVIVRESNGSHVIVRASA